MRVIVKENKCIVTKEIGDRFYKDSTLMYEMKRILKLQGYDLIKKLMVKDGHLVSEGQYYLRSRNPNAKVFMAIWDTAWSIRNSVDAFNAPCTAEVTFTVETWCDEHQIKGDKSNAKD
jgi:hypothetical protein